MRSAAPCTSISASSFVAPITLAGLTALSVEISTKCETLTRSAAATMFMVPLWGWLADRVAERIGKRAGRQRIVWLGIGCSSLLMLAGSHTANNKLAAMQLAAAAGFNLGASAILWTTCSDISKKFAGSVSGVMVTFGSLGGWFSPVITAKIATAYGWTVALDVAAVLMIAGGAAWIFVNAEEFVE